jgi:hypothetical protein
VQEHLALRGDPDPAPVAPKEPHTKRLLQIADRLRDRRLADVQAAGGADDAAASGHLDENPQVAKFDPLVHADQITEGLWIGEAFSFFCPDRL